MVKEFANRAIHAGWLGLKVFLNRDFLRSLSMSISRNNRQAVPNWGWLLTIVFAFAACSTSGGATGNMDAAARNDSATGGQSGQAGTGGVIPSLDAPVGGKGSGTGGASASGGGNGSGDGGAGSDGGSGGAVGGSGGVSGDGGGSRSGEGGSGGAKGDALAPLGDAGVDQGPSVDVAAADKPAVDIGTPDTRSTDTVITISDSDSTGPIAHRALISGSGTLSIIGPTGKVEWTGLGGGMDCWFLSNGNILHAYGNGVRETKPDYVSGNGGTVIWDRLTVDGETHSCQPLEEGTFLVAESHNGGISYIVEIDRSKAELKKLLVSFPATESAHTQFRQVRKLPSGNYLYAEQHGDGVEIDPTGKELHRYAGGTFEALRLPNGNTLVSGGYANQMLEYDQDNKVVWQVTPDEFKALGITPHFIAGVARLDNGDIVFSNWNAPPAEAAVYQMTREKKIVWSLMQQPKNTGDSSLTTACRILDGIAFPPVPTP
jgi:hypothetical protein